MLIFRETREKSKSLIYIRKVVMLFEKFKTHDFVGKVEKI